MLHSICLFYKCGQNGVPNLFSEEEDREHPLFYTSRLICQFVLAAVYTIPL